MPTNVKEFKLKIREADATSANAPDPPLITPACPYTSSPCLKSEG